MENKRDQIDKIPAWQELPGDLQGSLYERIAEHIRREIRSGHFREGARLPSKRSLAESLGVSLTSVNTAYDILTAEGYLLSYPRSCYKVGPLAELYLHMPAAETEPQDEVMNAGENQEAASLADEGQAEPKFRYDFSVKGVDESLFREKSIKRIYKKIIDEGALTAEPEARGLTALRRELAALLLSSQGIRVNPDNIVISYGTMGLFRYLFELLPRGTVYGMEDPGMQALQLAFRRSRREFHYLPVGVMGIRPEDLYEKRIDAACLTPGHQFPSGIEYAASVKHALLKWAYEKSGRWLIEDDYDGMIRHRPGGESLKKLDRAAGRVLYIGSFSRSWSPGLRISYICLTDELSRKARGLGLPASNPVPLTEQAFLAELIRSNVFERHLNRARRLYRRKRRRLIEAIRESRLPWSVHAGPAGLHITVRFASELSTADDFAQACARRGIRVTPLDTFCFEEERPSWVLLGFGRIPEEDIKPAVEEMEKIWKEEGFC